ncbi:MAG TPA: HlyD family secretion protein [Thermoanaerobaculia bacterium]|nr:HlyD family secretion protein [Thermoanaerobaculia bacterium]
MRVEREKPGPEEPEVPAAKPRRGARRFITLGVLALLLIAAAIAGARTVSFYEHHETTDDAQIDGHIDPVLPRVSGFVAEVLVKQNQPVRAGDVLVRIDPRDLQTKVDQELASLVNAQAAVSVAEAAVASNRARVAASQADIAAARTREQQTGADVARYKALWDKEEISQQQYEAARATADAARAAVEAARATSQSAASQVQAAEQQVAAARAQVAQHQAALEAAKLQTSYAVITAPVSGVVSKKSVEIGQFVQAGQPLMAIVQGHDVWVTANFKETQLAKMSPGQTVDVEVDAYPGTVFHGRVESLAAATGAKFSLLPPDNATGNFTKVVQRIPVKIVFTGPPDPKRPLRVGMNVNVVVNVG